MVSSAEYWINGFLRWRVMHDGQEHIKHISTVGQLPKSYADALLACETSIKNQTPKPKSDNTQQVPADLRSIVEGMGMSISPFDANNAIDFHFEVPAQTAYGFSGIKYEKFDDCTLFELKSID